MISSADGVAILKKWRRERVLVSFFALSTGDFASSWAAKIRAADGPILEVEMVGSADIQRFNLAGALFDAETPDDLPFNIEDLGRFCSFLFIRLADGLPIFFAVPERPK